MIELKLRFALNLNDKTITIKTVNYEVRKNVTIEPYIWILSRLQTIIKGR